MQEERSSQSEGTWGVLDVVIVLAKRKGSILVTTTMAFLTSVLIVGSMPDQYRAMSTFVVEQKAQWDLDAFIVVNSGMGAIANDAYGLTQDPILYVNILRSSSVVRRVVREVGLDGHAIERLEEWVRDATNVESTKEGIITASVTWPDAGMAANIANAFSTVIDRLSDDVNRKGIHRIEEFLVEVEAELEGDLQALEKQRSEMGREQVVVDLGRQKTATYEVWETLFRDLIQEQLDLETRLVTRTESSSKVLELESRVSNLKSEIRRVLEQSEDMPIGFHSVPEKERALSSLERDLAQKSKLLAVVQGQLGILAVRKRQPSSSVILLDEAEPPDYAIGPRRSRLVVIAVIAGFVVGVFLALGLESLAQRAKPQTREKLHRLRLHLGRLPWRRNLS